MPWLLAQRAPADLEGITGWVVDVIAALGAVGVGALTLLENLFPPLPSEVVLPLAGFLTGQGRLSFPGTLAAATAGSLIGAWVLYGAGAWLGMARVERIARRLPLVADDDVHRAQRWFRRHGHVAVLVGRLVPGVRSVVSLPAGVERMPLGRFTAYTLAGSLGWNAVLVSAGWALGTQWHAVARWADVVDRVLVAAAVVALARFLWKRRRVGSAR